MLKAINKMLEDHYFAAIVLAHTIHRTNDIYQVHYNTHMIPEHPGHPELPQESQFQYPALFC